MTKKNAINVIQYEELNFIGSGVGEASIAIQSQELTNWSPMPDTNGNPEYWETIILFLETTDLFDPWRTHNPLTRLFTFRC